MRRYIPTVLTLSSVFCGWMAFYFFAFAKDVALFLVIGAAFLDVLDGFAARRLGVTSIFGGQMDSLADFMNFGVLPAALIYDVSLEEFLGLWGWLLAGIFVAAGMLRLAKFNARGILSRYDESEIYFLGLPLPFSGLIVYMMAFGFVPDFVVGVTVLSLSFLMLTSMRFYSLGKFLLGLRPRFMALGIFLLGGIFFGVSVFFGVWYGLGVLVLIQCLFSLIYSLFLTRLEA